MRLLLFLIFVSSVVASPLRGSATIEVAEFEKVETKQFKKLEWKGITPLPAKTIEIKKENKNNFECVIGSQKIN